MALQPNLTYFQTQRQNYFPNTWYAQHYFQLDQYLLECYHGNFVRLQRLVRFQSQHVRYCVQCNLLQGVLFTIWFIFAQLGSVRVAERTKAPNHFLYVRWQVIGTQLMLKFVIYYDQRISTSGLRVVGTGPSIDDVGPFFWIMLI